MRVFRRKLVAALLLMAAVAIALMTQLALSGSLADCPAGTNWDWAAQSCQ